MPTEEKTIPVSPPVPRRSLALAQWVMVVLMGASLGLYVWGHERPEQFFAVRDALVRACRPGAVR